MDLFFIVLGALLIAFKQKVIGWCLVSFGFFIFVLLFLNALVWRVFYA